MIDSIVSPIPPDRRVVDAYRPSQGRACTIEHFAPDFQSSARTPYNKSVAQVFTEYFMDSDLPETATANPEDVTNLYFARFRSLRRQMRLDRDPMERERVQVMNRRNERKTWVCICHDDEKGSYQ